LKVVLSFDMVELKSSNRLSIMFSKNRDEVAGPKFVFIKIGCEHVKVSFSDIIYVEAVNKYVRLITRAKVYLVSSTMSHMENILPADIFCRIHRSYIVSLEHTYKYDHDGFYIDNKQLPIGKRYRKSLPGMTATLSIDGKKADTDINGAA
jgi:DNA-binding LytR/AlgR family response regulator